MFGNNTGIQLSVKEQNNNDIIIKTSADRDAYILLAMGFAIILTTYLYDPVKSLTFAEFIDKKSFILAIGLSVIFYSLLTGFKKYNFHFDVQNQICHVTEKHLFINKKTDVQLDDIRLFINIADSEGPSRYIACLSADQKNYLLGESSDRDYFTRTLSKLDRFSIKCEVS